MDRLKRKRTVRRSRNTKLINELEIALQSATIDVDSVNALSNRLLSSNEEMRKVKGGEFRQSLRCSYRAGRAHHKQVEVDFPRGENRGGLSPYDLVQGKTLLEVGTGPTMNNVLSASRQFKDIVLRDMVDANRVELEKWLNGKEDALDCSFRAEMVASLEGCSDVKKRAFELAERTRQAIRKVIPCDVLEPGVLPDQHLETFDAVLCCNCLEAATQDHAPFRLATCNVAGLVKPGGLLILAGFDRGEKEYPVGNEVFPMAELNGDVIKQALADAGLKVEVHQTKMYDGPDRDAVGRRFAFVAAARKA
ncbi:hypothetical protein HPB47_013107 [Ixodes persulcatus]|uniref:Uncharacterized protein n=1 Tax=Ixodes persulcatus TaxID=34615 RepID=A0AC60NRP4_IXOPE|nr:hypothetical protein HPB47_013107 [Ixodes persulcatus]